MSLHYFLMYHLRRHVKISGFILHHGFQTTQNGYGFVLSSVTRCLEPVMKHSRSFLTYYMKHFVSCLISFGTLVLQAPILGKIGLELGSPLLERWCFCQVCLFLCDENYTT